MSVPIKATMEKVPGGMMLIPLLLGAILGTFAPDSAKFFGSFTGALFTDADLVSPPGKYAIVRGTLAATANYDVSFTPGEMTVISTGSVAEPVKGPTEVKLGIVVPPWRDPAPNFRTEVFTTLPTASIPAAAASTSTGLHGRPQ